MPAYSVDLRERIVKAYLQGEGSFVTLAKRFSVSRNSVRDYVALYKRTGSVEPLPPSGGNPTQKLFEQDWQMIESWLDADPNLMWRQVADKLHDEHNIKIDPSQISRILKRRGYTRKKTRPATPK